MASAESSQRAPTGRETRDSQNLFPPSKTYCLFRYSVIPNNYQKKSICNQCFVLRVTCQYKNIKMTSALEDRSSSMPPVCSIISPLHAYRIPSSSLSFFFPGSGHQIKSNCGRHGRKAGAGLGAAGCRANRCGCGYGCVSRLSAETQCVDQCRDRVSIGVETQCRDSVSRLSVKT